MFSFRTYVIVLLLDLKTVPENSFWEVPKSLEIFFQTKILNAYTLYSPSLESIRPPINFHEAFLHSSSYKKKIVKSLIFKLYI